MAGNVVAAAAGAAAWALSAINASAWLQTPLTSATFNISAELGPLLSSSAQIYLPGSDGFIHGADRWQEWAKPTFDAVVKVSTHEDVEQTIRYANIRRKPFLAVSGQHGATRAIGSFQHGIGIWLKDLDGIDISEDGNTAVIGGGITSGGAAHRLWAEGKQTVTGCCECTGMVAPMLGGGHGWLQGQYGKAGDNLVSARVVLANGTSVTASDDEHADLFWALRGAGHNFGILTEFKYKVYDRTPDNEKWAYETLIFTQDKLDPLFAEANKMIWGGADKQDVNLTHYVYWLRNPEIDPDNLVIVFYLLYQGERIPEQYTRPLHAIGPVVTKPAITDLIGIAEPSLLTFDSVFCQHGGSGQRFPVSTRNYSVEALREAMNIFQGLPTALNGSAMLLEAFSMQRVKEIPEESTAYPDRYNNLLLSPYMVYPPNAGLDEEASHYGKRIREVLVKASGQPHNAYVNYAHGDETQEALYGYEPWRLEKLRRLKKEYDPHDRFSYYAPIL